MTPREPKDRSPAEVTPLLVGTPYRALRFLGRGGMGEVWVVEHAVVRRQFALKILHARFTHSVDRMRVEAETLGRLSHPNVVEVIDFWVASEGRACVVMELLQGRTLWDELAERIRPRALAACSRCSTSAWRACCRSVLGARRSRRKCGPRPVVKDLMTSTRNREPLRVRWSNHCPLVSTPWCYAPFANTPPNATQPPRNSRKISLP